MKKSLIIWGLVGIVSLAGVFYFLPFDTQAGEDDEGTAGPLALTGYAWSSNVGWLSFSGGGSGVNYGVDLVQDETTPQLDGYLRGYAWSPNIGWVRFDPTIFPATRNSPWGALIESDGDVTGWARACVAYVSGCSGAEKTIGGTELGGWSGWIKMSGLATNGSPYGVELEGNNLRGFAWGDDVVGWLNFDLTGNVGPGDCSESVCIGGGNLSASCTGTANGQDITWRGNYTNGSSATTCSWDLDSDGSHDDGNSCEVTQTYTGSGSRTASLRVVDGSRSAQTSCSATLGASTQCNDGIDNDGHGQTDYPNDPGCSGPEDDDELSQCADNLNNDPAEDSLFDYINDGDDDGAVGSADDGDPDCADLEDDSEAGGGVDLNPVAGSQLTRITEQPTGGTGVSSPFAQVENVGTGSITIDVKRIMSQRHTSLDLMQSNPSYPDSGTGILTGSGNQLLPQCWLEKGATLPEPPPIGWSASRNGIQWQDCGSLDPVTLGANERAYIAVQIWRPVRRIRDENPYVIWVGDVNTPVTDTDLQRNAPLAFVFSVSDVLDE